MELRTRYPTQDTDEEKPHNNNYVSGLRRTSPDRVTRVRTAGRRNPGIKVIDRSSDVLSV